MDNSSSSKFTCQKCGGHELVVTHTWNIQAGTDSENWREWGALRMITTGNMSSRKKSRKMEIDEVQRGDFGEFEEDDSDSEPEDYEINEAETNREADEFYVNCGNCDRQIEFGWSQPDRRGLIWPVGFSDFNPRESWPDPKYVDAWQQRGWFRAGHIQK